MANAIVTIVIKDDRGDSVSRTIAGDVGGNLTRPGILESELDKVYAKARDGVVAAVRT